MTANLTALRHRDRGLPDTGHERQRRRAARLPGERGEGARPRRGARRKRAAERQPVALRRCRLYRRQIRFVSRRATAARGDRRTGSSRTSRDPSCPGISKWAFSVGGEYAQTAVALRTGRSGLRRASTPATARPSRRARAIRGTWSSTATRWSTCAIGFRAANGWTVFLWSRNLLDKEYFELLTAAPGNTGLYVGQPGRRANRRRDAAAGAQGGRKKEDGNFSFFLLSSLLLLSSSFLRCSVSEPYCSPAVGRRMSSDSAPVEVDVRQGFPSVARRACFLPDG